MQKLIARFGKAVKGVLRGFDRIVFKGTILPLAHEQGAMSFLGWRGVLNRDYKKWMLTQTDALVKALDRHAREQTGRPIIHLNSWQADKEKLARKRQEQAGIKSGLIGAWSCMESCWSYRALLGGRRPAASHRLRVEGEGKETPLPALVAFDFHFLEGRCGKASGPLI